MAAGADVLLQAVHADFPEVVMKRTIIEALIIIAIVVVIWLAFVYSMRWWLLDFLCWLWRLAG